MHTALHRQFWTRFVVAAAWASATLAAAAADPSPTAAAVPPATLGTEAAAATRLPPTAFFRRDDIADARLSPSGRYLAVTVLAPDQRYALAVIDLDTPGASRPVAYFSGLDITDFEWVTDERLVFSTYDGQSGGGEQMPSPGLFSVKRDSSELRVLVQLRSPVFSNTLPRPGDRTLGYAHTRLHVPGEGDEVIVGEWRFDGVGDLTMIVPKRLNVATGRVTSIAQGAPAFVKQWLFDSQGNPRVARSDHAGQTRIFWREAPQGDDAPVWKEIAAFDSLHAPWLPRAVDADGRLYVTTVEGAGGVTVLKRFDFRTGRPEAQTLVATPGFDFTGNLVAETPGDRMLGLRVETDAELTVWTDPVMKALQAEIDRRLPGRINRLACRHCGTPEMAVLVRSYNDRDPGQYWVWRGPVAAPTMWQPVGERRKGSVPGRMATVDFHRFAARDGLSIPVYVTLPAGTQPGQTLPAVVLVHGGPGARGGHWVWDPMTQFLASRGYAVLAPEFRGGTGFGTQHHRAGWKQWGQAMQDDVADTVAWAAKQGLIDPARVCIAGASYGGYATLMGLVRHPDLYRCGAAWVAATEPSLLFTSSWESDLSADGRRYFLPVILGDPVADADMLRRYSPVQQAARIKAPVLMAFGMDDRRVPLEHGTRMRAALRGAGQEPEYVVYPGEGHGWLRIETQLDFAQRLEAFLARNLR